MAYKVKKKNPFSFIGNIRRKIISDSQINRLKKNPKFKVFRKRHKEIIILSILAIFFLFTIFHSEKTILLDSRLELTKESAQSYIFTDSEYIDIKAGEKIDYTVSEGQKVGANTKLSKTYKIQTNKYIDEALKVIDWRLKHKPYKKRDMYFTELVKLEDELELAEDEYNRAKTSNDQMRLTKAKFEYEKLAQERKYMRKSIKYIFSDNASLNRVKKELKAKKKKKKKSLTISNLNFSFPGYIYFSRTGFEEVLNTNVLGTLGQDYFDYLKKYKPDNTGSDNTIIKIVNNDYAYVCPIFDKDVQVSGEDEAKSLHAIVKKNHKLKTEDDYYNYLSRRVDALITYPTITFEDSEGNENKGYIVNSIDYGENQKILVICLKDTFDNLINIDVGKLTYCTNKVTVYEIPKKAIIKQNDKTYVYAITSGNFKELVEVKVYEEGFNSVLLRPIENENLSENMEIVVNPD